MQPTEICARILLSCNYCLGLYHDPKHYNNQTLRFVVAQELDVRCRGPPFSQTLTLSSACDQPSPGPLLCS